MWIFYNFKFWTFPYCKLFLLSQSLIRRTTIIITTTTRTKSCELAKSSKQVAAPSPAPLRHCPNVQLGLFVLCVCVMSAERVHDWCLTKWIQFRQKHLYGWCKRRKLNICANSSIEVCCVCSGRVSNANIRLPRSSVVLLRLPTDRRPQLDARNTDEEFVKIFWHFRVTKKFY